MFSGVRLSQGSDSKIDNVTYPLKASAKRLCMDRRALDVTTCPADLPTLGVSLQTSLVACFCVWKLPGGAEMSPAPVSCLPLLLMVKVWQHTPTLKVPG